MIGNDELIDIYKTDFLLIKEHNFSLTEIDDMLPFERKIYVNMVLEYLEKKKELLNKRNNKGVY